MPVILNRRKQYSTIPLENIVNFQTLSTIIQDPDTGIRKTFLQTLIDQAAPDHNNILNDLFERCHGVEYASRILAYVTSPQWPRVSDSLWLSLYSQLKTQPGKRMCEALLADKNKHPLLLRPLAIPLEGMWETNSPPRPIDIILFILLWDRLPTWDDNSHTFFHIPTLVSSFHSLLTEPVFSRKDFHNLFILNYHKNNINFIKKENMPLDFPRQKPLVIHLARYISQIFDTPESLYSSLFVDKGSIDIMRIEKNILYGISQNEALRHILRQAINSPKEFPFFQKAFPSLTENFIISDAMDAIEPTDFDDGILPIM